MVSKSNKRNNIPYYITAFSATLLFAGSVVFAVAPYIEPLASIADLGFIIAAFSIPLTMLVFALSYKAVRQNKALAEKETQLAGKEEEIEAISKTIAEQETQLVKKTEEIEAQNQTIAEIKAQLAENVREIQSQSKRVIDSYIKGQPLREARKANKTAVEGDMHLESLFENISGDGVAQPRSDLHEALQNEKKLVFAPELSYYLKASLEQEKLLMKVATEFGKAFTSTKEAFSDGRALNIVKRDILLPSVEVATEFGKAGFTYTKEKLAKAYMVFTEIGGNLTEKVKAGEWFSQGQVLAGIGTTLGFAYLLAQRFISPASNALSPANNSINAANGHNNPASSPANPFNPGTMLDDKLNQTEATLEAAKEKAKKGFNVNPKKRNFVDDEAQKKSTLIQDSGTVERYISSLKDWFFSLFISKDTAEAVIEGKVGQNDSIQAKEAVIEEKVGHNKSAFHNGCPAPGLQGIVLSHQSIPRSAPPSGP